jgi:anthranilate/para-aminobenzoate synthase component II
MFKGLPDSFSIGKYHSLFALPEKLPQELKVTAMSAGRILTFEFFFKLRSSKLHSESALCYEIQQLIIIRHLLNPVFDKVRF